jgi:hypothetical protein
MALGEARFFTITSASSDTLEETWDRFPARWKSLHRRLKRSVDGTLEYVLVVEAQASGAAHAHVVFRGGYLPQPVLRSAAVASGFGSVVDIRPAHPGLPGYLTKQLAGPLPHAPRSFRRVRYSSGWAPAASPSREPETHAEPAVSWARAFAPTEVVADQMRARGYRIAALVASPVRDVARWVTSYVRALWEADRTTANLLGERRARPLRNRPPDDAHGTDRAKLGPRAPASQSRTSSTRALEIPRPWSADELPEESRSRHPSGGRGLAAAEYVGTPAAVESSRAL